MAMHSKRPTFVNNESHSQNQNLINNLVSNRESALKLGARFVAHLIDVAVLALIEFDPNKPDSQPLESD